jgi:hypothetical protein
VSFSEHFDTSKLTKITKIRNFAHLFIIFTKFTVPVREGKLFNTTTRSNHNLALCEFFTLVKFFLKMSATPKHLL